MAEPGTSEVVATAAVPASASESTTVSPADAVVATPSRTATILAGSDVKPSPPVDAAKPTWPEDWRDRLAAGDEKVRRRLDRFADPAAIWKSYTRLEAKLRSAPIRPPAPPEGASPEAIAAWRKEMGIPETPEGYLKSLPPGLVIGADDAKPVGEFLTVAHRMHAPPAVVARMIDWYYKNLETIHAEQHAKDAAAKAAIERALRSEWGSAYRRNLNLVAAYLDTAPAGVKSTLLHGRGADGRLLVSTPEVVRWLLAMALEINPVATVVPGAESGAGIQERKQAIEKMMREDRRAYDRDPKIQQEYRELIEAEQRIGRGKK
jgi:hypothetical protein